LRRQLLDRPLALGEHLEHLEPPGIVQPPGDPSDLVVQAVLELAAL
jgi:hypothetical protein